MSEPTKAETRSFEVRGMDCASCAQELADGVRRLPGVDAAECDFATGRLTVAGDVPFAALQTRAQAFGKTLISTGGVPAAGTTQHVHDTHNHEHARAHNDTPMPLRAGVLGFYDYLGSREDTRAALTGAVLVLGALILSLFTDASVVDGLIIAGMVVAGLPIARSGLNALRINRRFNINMLMTIAAVGAVVIGEYLEGAVVVILFAVGEALEGFTAGRAREGIRALLALKPARAAKFDGEREIDVAAETLVPGDLVVVRPGEAIPADGVVAHGASGVNQAPVTGESVPVYKGEGDAVYAGTLNGDGLLRVTVTRAGEDNTINRIIKLVEEAQSVRAPSQRIIDRFAAWYTPAVAALALLVAIVPPLIFGAPFYDTADEHGWLYRALALLVIACPCALVISTPVTVISAMAAAARRGVLIKGGAFLEALGGLKAVAFDKTGTLTTGKLRVTDMQSDRAGSNDDLLAYAAALERQTTHPLARAVVDAAKESGVDQRYAAAEQVELIPGRGVRGMVGGRTLTIGSHAYFEEKFPHDDALCAWAGEQEAAGRSTMMLADEQAVVGAFALADTLRSEARSLVGELAALNIQTVMLTGDHRRAAEEIAGKAGVTHVRAGLLPEQKVGQLRDLQAQFGAVAMVGDGVNDAPALAASSVGIAMGGAGSPQALETADVALMADDLSALPFAVRLSRFARGIIRQNVVLSFGLKALFVGLALEGAASLWLAVLADVGMSLVVTLNGMRPLRRH